MPKTRCTSRLIVLIALATFIRAVAAQPAPALTNLPAVALKQGQSIDVVLSGQNLAGLASVSVPDPRGFSATIVKPDKPNDGEVRLKLSAAADAALGEREFRLIGPAGATRPVRAFVSQYTVVPEKEPNNSPAEAQDVSLPATIVGRIDGPGDVDQFRFAASKGQTLVFDIDAARSGSPLDTVATVHSAAGREMRTRVERRSGDPIVVFEVPEDGQYLLRLRDLQYRGGGDYAYRINAGRIPFVEALFPSSGVPGKVIEAHAVGYNLGAGEKIDIDLTSVPPGTIEVRAKADAGFSNPALFEVTELPQAVEAEPNDKPENANPVSIPSEISGHMDAPGDQDMFRFHVAYKRAIGIEVLAGRFGSPFAPLLQLRNAKGEVIENNDGTPDADARISRELDPGDYVVSVRDLTFAGGPGYWYRLKLESASNTPQDFAVRFLPDAPRIHRGGNFAMWCEVKRFNGFHGDVTLSPEGLPAGVTAAPIVMPENASGWFTLAAAPDAALGTAGFRLRATAQIGTVTVSHFAEPEADGRPTGEAYLTVLEPAPFAVQAVPAMSAEQLAGLNGEIAAIAARLNTPDPRLAQAMAEWERKLQTRPQWTVLQPAVAVSAKSTPLTTQPSDGSFLVTGNSPAQDQYLINAHTSLKGITAVRLEVLADEHLPSHGPGAAPNGNFVLSEFKLSAFKDGQPPQPVAFKRASADFSQANFPVSAAIDNNPQTGWAIDPQEGKSHTAVFEAATPFGFDEGTNLAFTIDQASPFPQHNLGRFRLSVTTADPATLQTQAEVPQNILAIVDTPADKRSADQKTQLVDYFRSTDPQTQADRARLEALRSFAAPYAEIDRLQKLLKDGSPQLDAEQAAWEQSLAQGAGWSVLEIADAHASGGSQLHRESDGSVFADGPSPATDTYTLTANTAIKRITALRLEALPDSRLPGGGPGRAADGNFVLSRFHVLAVPKPAPTTQPTTQPATQPTTTPAPADVLFDRAQASVEQQNFPIGGALDDKDETGWAVSPYTGRPAEATFYLKSPLEGDGGATLTIGLEHLSKFPQFTLGRFRIWVTNNREPDSAPRLPENIAAIVKSPAGGRSDVQKRELAAYFRSIAPSLEPVRRRLADLRGQVPALPLKVKENQDGSIPVPVTRAGDFKQDVQVTLEGFAAGREGGKPAPISRNVRVNTLTVPADKQFGTLTFRAEGIGEPATRMVVLKAEAKVGNETVVEYSPAFPLTIEK